jgi:hypothetical protein
LEADWEIEIGGDAPVIDACWPGFVDLRMAPDKAFQLTEVIELSALGSALATLNAPDSPFLTVKCDVWPVETINPIDPIEFDAPPESAVHALACYIDLVQRDASLWTAPQAAIHWCKKICSALQTSSLHCSRIDLVIRSVVSAADQSSIGVTAYVAACGPTTETARAQLALALKMLTECILSTESGNREPL